MTNIDINIEFKQFGSRMQLLGILMILSFILNFLFSFASIIISIVSFVVMLIAVGNIKRINEKLNNPNLEKFRSKYIISIILGVIGTMILMYASAMFISLVIRSNLSLNDIFIAFITLFIIGGIFFFIAMVFQKGAWKNLKTFFEYNSTIFRQDIAADAYNGAKKLEQACLCFLLFFLIVTLIIGVILQLIGYFKLGKLKEQQITIQSGSQQQISNQQQNSPQNTSQGAFCPSCGTQLAESLKFCPSCGEKI